MTTTGSLARRLLGAEELIARSAAFRARVGSGSITATKKRISYGEVTLSDVLAMVEGGTLEFARPSAVLGINSHRYVQLAQGGQLDLGANGAVWVIFCDAPADPANHKTSYLDFCDWISQVTDDVAAAVGKDVGAEDYTLWPFNAIDMFFEPLRADIADRPADDYWLAGYVLSDSILGGGA